MTRSSPAIDPAPACSRTGPARCCPWPLPPCSLLLAPPYDGGGTKSWRRVPSADPTVDGCCGRLDLELIYQSSAQVNLAWDVPFRAPPTTRGGRMSTAESSPATVQGMFVGGAWRPS